MTKKKRIIKTFSLQNHGFFVGAENGAEKIEVENRGYKCGYFRQKWGGFRVLGSGHTDNSDMEDMDKTRLDNVVQTDFYFNLQT